MQDLGARVVLSRTRVSRLVDELEAEGLVERRPDPNDGRCTIAAITANGERSFRAAAPVYLASIDEHFNRHLSERERKVIAAGLDRVVEAHALPLASSGTLRRRNANGADRFRRR